MRPILPALLAAAALALTAASARAFQVQQTIAVDATPETVWEMVGDFCSIAEWHPDVATCTLEADDATTYRTVETTDGKSFREQLLEKDDESQFYSASLVESPWLVTGLLSEFEVSPGPDGTSVIVWQAETSTLAVDEDEAMDELAALYRSGLKGIAALFDQG